jgi:hypothetical protein
MPKSLEVRGQKSICILVQIKEHCSVASHVSLLLLCACRAHTSITSTCNLSCWFITSKVHDGAMGATCWQSFGLGDSCLLICLPAAVVHLLSCS